ncbi:MAG: tRNA(His) guanylyltransferase Thg1 family protein [Clostridia bacterium]|nr:tRNA(His) guanylyltransferase Thg1 family protein [Clostridia bacterium]
MAKEKNFYESTPPKYSYDYAQEKYRPFKQNEKVYDWRLKQNYYYIIRFDGKGMTKGFKIKHQAINKSFFDTMEDTFNEFCKSTPNILFGYSFSDEISILIRGNNNYKDDNNRIQKLLSLLSGKLALMFYRNAQKNNLDLQNKDWVFDARILQLNRKEVGDYFLARQAYAIDKYIMQLKTENDIDYKFKTSKVVISKLKDKDVIYEKLPKKYRYGLIYSPTKILSPFEFDANISQLKQLCFSKNLNKKTGT